uniref:TOG domain-containing protein n=1 Tax=Globisporangium ultimum (strain ATCC 200006 / CBS 805.95 / DAOM BR144) TaxID=431595 RepID=K3W704_GLOUD
MATVMNAEQEAQLGMLAMKLQRDINCISDPDRAVRRRALDKLQRALTNDAPTTPPVVLQTLCSVNMKAALFACAGQDVVEKCREKALTLLLFFAERNAMELSEAMLKDLVALLSARMGKLPYSEPTEEIRLLMLQLTCQYLKKMAADTTSKHSLLAVIPDLANVLGKTALDPFPDVKKITADCAIVLSNGWRSDVALQLGAIVKPMVTNLGHQHSRVRVGALQALEALVPCGSDALVELMKEVVLPAVSKVVFDHSASVRKQFVLMLATWFQRIAEIQQFHASLFPLFLAGIVDESPEVQQAALAKLPEVATAWENAVDGALGDDAEPMVIDGDVASSAVTPPAYFPSRPSAATRKLATSIQSEVLPTLLEKTSDWTVQVRERYTKILSVFLVLLESNMNSFLDKIFAALGKICRDDEDAVVKSVKQCSGVVGSYADSQMILASLLPMAAGRLAGQDTAQHRTNGLILLGMSIEGMSLKTIEPHLELITEALCDAGLRESEAADLQDQLAGVVSSLLKTAGPVLPQHDEIVFRLFWVLNHLLASSSESSIAYETALYLRYLGKILDKMVLLVDAASSWKKNDPSRILFDSLCRRGGAACGASMDKIVPALLVHLDAARDADVRLAFLALLETMLGTESVYKAFQPFSVPLLLNGIIPNIVWQGGRVAATIRKVAVACAYTLLRQGLADQACLFETAPKMLPVLKSSMDDSDAKTRQLVCLALQYLFVALPGCLGEEPVHQLYAEILKRLDDSNDTVRKAACQTFSTFLRAAPKEHFKGTIIDYTLDCLFVHLDDSDPSIQEAVFNVIKDAIDVDKPLVAKKAQENRSRHQNPTLCDQILALTEA